MTEQQESILVVDDDLGVLTALEAELEDYFIVTAVTGAEQALVHLQGRDFSAIISDVRMPGVDGLSLIGQCAVRYPDMVRVILTAFDGEDVLETALGPHGAFKLVKPWGDDLLVTLRNALKQRKSNLDLKRHLDLKTELLDIDRRLHTHLTADELYGQAAIEMSHLAEVTSAALYVFNTDGTLKSTNIIKSLDGSGAPQLRRESTTAVAFKGQYLYSVPIGEWSNPSAAVALELSSAPNDTIRYLDFIGRQAYRTLRLIYSGSFSHMPKTNYSGQDDKGMVAASWVMAELTTPATVLSSANDSLTRMVPELREQSENSAVVAESAQDLTELTQDLDRIYSAIVSLLDSLKSIDEDAGRRKSNTFQ